MLQSLLMLSYVGFNNESRCQWTSLSLLCMYYRREIERSLHQCGQWSVKDEYSHLKREPSLLPYIDIAPSPEKIVAVVRRGIAVTVPPNVTRYEKTRLSAGGGGGIINLRYGFLKC